MEDEMNNHTHNRKPTHKIRLASALLGMTLLLAFLPASASLAAGRNRTTPQPSEPTPAPAPLNGAPEGYELRFADEFDGTEIDETNWNIEVGPWPYNGELEYYTRENAWIEDGALVIEARQEALGGRRYTSARLSTLGKRDYTYGYWEVRAALPTARGTWSAIWLLLSDLVYGGYLRSGEIDVAERVGYDAKLVHATFHTYENNSVNDRAITAFARLSRKDDGFHTYGLLWEEDSVAVYLDGAQVLRYQRLKDYSPDNWPFDVPFHLILNVAVGGSWGGIKGVDDEAFPQRMLVDYVRYYIPPDVDFSE